MKEKYESLALADLRQIAKSRGLKGTSAMKKADLVSAMLMEDEKAKPSQPTAPTQSQQDKMLKSSENQPEKASKASENRPAKTSRVSQSQPEKASKAAEGQPEKASKASESQPEKVSRGSESQPEKVSRASENQPEKVSRTSENQPEKVSRASENQPEKTSRASENQPEKVSRASENQPEKTSRASESQQREKLVRTADTQQDKTRDPRYTKGEERSEDEKFPAELDSGVAANGILEVMPDGYGFIRCENYLPGENDVYVAPSQIRRFNLKTGDIVEGNTRVKTQAEKFSALLFVKKINGFSPDVAMKRRNFEDMTPIFPNQRIRLETQGASIAMRIMDLMSPVGKGQRGMIVSPPKAGKTTLLKEVAKSIKNNNPELHLIILLIDERPEEVTDIREAIEGENVEVIYSTFDELPEHHKRVSEMVMERAKRLVEHKKEVVILLDSITRLTRAYNLTVPPSGRTLSGGLDPAALHMPKRFFGAARNMREGGSLTILATALVETGSKMDDVVYEEFKGTGNMEMVLDRKLSERRVFPAIDIPKSGTRREDLLLSPEELEAINIMRKALNSMKADEAVDRIVDMFSKTKNNNEFVNMVKKIKFM